MRGRRGVDPDGPQLRHHRYAEAASLQQLQISAEDHFGYSGPSNATHNMRASARSPGSTATAQIPTGRELAGIGGAQVDYNKNSVGASLLHMLRNV